MLYTETSERLTLNGERPKIPFNQSKHAPLDLTNYIHFAICGHFTMLWGQKGVVPLGLYSLRQKSQHKQIITKQLKTLGHRYYCEFAWDMRDTNEKILNFY